MIVGLCADHHGDEYPAFAAVKQPKSATRFCKQCRLMGHNLGIREAPITVVVVPSVEGSYRDRNDDEGRFS